MAGGSRRRNEESTVYPTGTESNSIAICHLDIFLGDRSLGADGSDDGGCPNPHFPSSSQGIFCLGVVVFSAFVVAVAGFLLAVLVGWWFYFGAVCYNRWGSRYGLALDVKIAEVVL